MDEADRLELAGLRADVRNLIKTIDEFKTKLSELGHTHISTDIFIALKDRVAMLEKVVFGGLGFVLIAVIGAGLALVLKK